MMILINAAPDGNKMSLIMFEKAERRTGVCYGQVLKPVKTWILFEYLERRDKRNTSKIAKEFKFTFQQDETLCHTSAVTQKISQR